MNITGPSDMTLDEIDEASNYIRAEVNEDAEIFWGVVFDDSMQEEVQVTVIATGIDSMDHVRAYSGAFSNAYSNVVKIRDMKPEEARENWTVRMDGQSLDVPTFQRKGAVLSESEKTGEKSKQKKGILSRLHIRDSLDYPTFLRAKAD
jgi:cell division protein FtsZ